MLAALQRTTGAACFGMASAAEALCAGFAQWRFNVGPGEVNLIANLFMILYIPGSIISLWVVQRCGQPQAFLPAGGASVPRCRRCTGRCRLGGIAAYGATYVRWHVRKQLRWLAARRVSRHA